jgi:hypothetical protein
MSKYLKGLFAVHAVITLVFGVPLLLVPGRTLDLFHREPQDPLLTRLLGAAFIALAVGSLRGFKTPDKSLIKTIIEMDLVFCVLGAIGFARHLFGSASYAPIIWLIFGLLTVFAIAWAVAYFKD